MAKKKQRKPKRSPKIYQFYEIKEEKITRKAKFCPKCGAGVFMAKRPDTWYCGKCHYVERIEKK